MQANEGEGSSYRGDEAVSAGLADEVVSTARNYDPARIAALVTATDADMGMCAASGCDQMAAAEIPLCSDCGAAAMGGAMAKAVIPDTETPWPVDFGQEFRKSASYTPEPTLEELMTREAAAGRITIGVGGK